MSFQLHPTPLAAPVPVPEPRAGGAGSAVLEAMVPGPGTAQLVEQLADPRTLVVTTGQQPALLLGPAYTLHKALTAAALAAELRARWDRPVVPVFWNAGDDHDWDEARTAWWRTASGNVVAASLPERDASAPMLPLYRSPGGPEMSEAVRSFVESMPASPWIEGVSAILSRTHGADATLAGAAGAALAELLAPLGILVLDSTHPSFKAAAAEHLLAALDSSEQLEHVLEEHHAVLVASGRNPGIATGGGATLVMLEGSAGRDRLVRHRSGYQLRRSGEVFSRAELDEIARREPSRLSPNVLLRPVIESALLPTVAYCAGPGELRYLPLTAPVFEQLGQPQPAAVPRWSGVVVEAPVLRAMERFGVDLETLLDPAADVLGMAAAEAMPAPAAAALRRLRSETERDLRALVELGTAEEDPLGRSIEGSRRRIEFELSRIQRRYVRSLKRRHADQLRQLARARTALLPLDRPQERLLSVLDLVGRHGAPLLDAVKEAARAHLAPALEGRSVPA
ncbi:MAG TPA: bacillithiol biosynthesis cysteine-adding enzyme BshC [Gemmatimonadales bacterium]|nr:bacillithiol biosynthesis cysteine-adding enzyme BshC [Gemmatimonadales bacterium]